MAREADRLAREWDSDVKECEPKIAAARSKFLLWGGFHKNYDRALRIRFTKQTPVSGDDCRRFRAKAPNRASLMFPEGLRQG